jgi:ubiquinone/menaquinone biosynthesis C-methylase UbiE
MESKTKVSSHERADDADFNNVTYQRCLFAYEFAKKYISGKSLLDIGCGTGYGSIQLSESARHVTALDYDAETIRKNKERFSKVMNVVFIKSSVPPIPFPDDSFEAVTAFQFIEHIDRRREFLKEAMRVLKPGGILLLTTPNSVKSFARNPFHVHEYTFDEIQHELEKTGGKFELKGLQGNQKVNDYYRENSKWVKMILKFDFINLHKILPSKWLTAPYNFITNLMRKKLKEEVKQTLNISTSDFFLQDKNLEETWDIYAVVRK